MMNRFVENGTVSKFWLIEITGLHVSIHCGIASEVMESFLSPSFLIMSIN